MLYLGRLVSLRTLAVVAIVAVAMFSVDRPALAITSDEHLERAQAYFAKNELNASIIELKNALQRDGTNAAARLFLGRVYISKGRGADAEKELQRSQELGADSRDFMVLIAQARLLQGNFQEALQDITIDETDAPARKAELSALRGEAQLGLDSTTDARQSFTTAVGHDPSNADAHAGLGRIAMQERSFDVAEIELARALAADPTGQTVLRLKGDLLFARGAFSEAERAFEELFEGYPFVPNLLRLAAVRSALGKNDEAIVDVGQVLRSSPKHAGANYLRALAAYRMQDYESAKFYVDQALTFVPLNPQFQLLAGATNYALGQNEQALRYLERYVAREPQDNRARRMLGATQLRLGNVEEARETLKPFEEEPDDAQLLALIGTAAVRSGNLKKGRLYFERLVELQPDNPAARAQLGAVQAALGEADEGIADLEKALEQDPNLDQALLSLAVAYLREARFARALDAARRLQANNPESAQAHTLVGVAHGGLGEIEAAAKAFNKALEIRPGATDAAVNLAAIKNSQGKLEEAYDLYNQVLENRPDHLQALLGLAALERRRDRPDEEVDLLERAVQRHPNSRSARIALGRAYVDRRAPQKALETTVGLLDQEPDNAAVLQVVGEAQLRVGDTDGALDTFRRLVEAKPDHAASHFHLARAFEAEQAFDKADIELQKALLLDSGHTQAKFSRARLLARQGDLELAKSILEDLKSAFPDNPALLELESRIALRQDRPGEAVELLQQALEKREDSNLVILLSQAQTRAVGFDEGIASLRDWIRRFPDDIRVRGVLARSYISLKRLGEAKTEYQAVLARAPENVPALNNLAWVLGRLGSAPEASVYARRAVALAPNNPIFLDTLGIILLEQGDSTEALVLLRQANGLAPRSTEIQFHLAKALAEAGETGEARDLLTELVSLDREFADRAEAEALLQRLP